MQRCVEEVKAISAVPDILQTLADLTGLGFICVAHVTDTTWTACAVLDRLNFGLKPGDPIDVTTTLCEDVRDTGVAIVIDSVDDSKQYKDHPTPRMYGFQSYFSIPLFRPGGTYFGTLCGLDPAPATLSNTATVTTMRLFAELISKQLKADKEAVAAHA
ncbi:MAG: histidine kinase [Massilia sp.]|nr:histidine kinase [Massilia sp.]